MTDSSAPTSRGPRSSLSNRVVAAVLLGELAFSLTLGLTIGLFMIRFAADERRNALHKVGEAVAASLMPVVADQQSEQLEAQVDSLLQMEGAREIECLRIVDSSGHAVVSGSSEGPCTSACFTQLSDQSPFGFLTQSQVIDQPVVVDGLEVARVYIQFAPLGLANATREPALALAIVILTVVLVSAPWTAWLFMKNVVEPLGAVRTAADDIAQGARFVAIDYRYGDEIGEVADSIEEMSRQLGERESSLQQSYDALSTAYAELDEAKSQVEQMGAIRSGFVAIASHELRTPLSIVRLYAEMLETGELGELSESAARAVDTISSASGRLSSIVSDLLDSALLDRGLMPMELDNVRLDQVVERAVSDANALAQPHGVTVALDAHAKPVMVTADATRIRQILDNLLSNAVKYSDGAELVTVRISANDGQTAVEVIDRGRGISEAEKTRLFGLFGRVDCGDSRNTAGLGLGLAISARIAEAHSGSITHHPNEEGPGSIFTLRIPAAVSELKETVYLEIDLPREGDGDVV